MTDPSAGALPPTAAAQYSALPAVTLVLGGARSGKSRYAEQLIEAQGGGTYLATAEALDVEMDDRIRQHRARRGALWRTVEEPLDIIPVLRDAASLGRPILIDCLTLWLSNLIHRERDVAKAGAELAQALPSIGVPVVLIANEVGLSIVPANALARRFRDEAGLLNQKIAASADRVWFIAAGLPLALK